MGKVDEKWVQHRVVRVSWVSSTNTTPTPQETDADISPLQYLCTLVDIADEPDETAHAVPSLLTRENQQCCVSVLSVCLLWIFLLDYHIDSCTQIIICYVFSFNYCVTNLWPTSELHNKQVVHKFVNFPFGLLSISGRLPFIYILWVDKFVNLTFQIRWQICDP